MISYLGNVFDIPTSGVLEMTHMGLIQVGHQDVQGKGQGNYYSDCIIKN